MQEFPENSIFDNWEEPFDPTVPNPDINNENIILQFDCFITHQDIQNNKLQKVYITLSNQFFVYRDKNQPKTFSICLQTCWCEDLEKDVETHEFIIGGFRLSKKDIQLDLLFDNLMAFNSAKKCQTLLAIQLDFEEKFLVQERLGHGASANVYKIQNLKTNAKYAGKFINKEYLMKNVKRVKSIINEMEVLRKINHPNVVKLIEVHEVEDHVILVMELQEGGSQSPDLLKNCMTPEIHIKKIFQQIIQGIRHLNTYGIMHRDIKPNNLRFVKTFNKERTNNVIKLIDFGFAEYYGNHKYTRYYCGTVGYMCPFIINNNKHNPINYGPECDLYSIGVQLFYILTGKKIFSAKNHDEKRKLNKENKINWDKWEKYNIDPIPYDLIKRLLTTDPKDRLSMNDLVTSPYFSNMEISNSYEDNFQEDKYKHQQLIPQNPKYSYQQQGIGRKNSDANGKNAMGNSGIDTPSKLNNNSKNNDDNIQRNVINNVEERRETFPSIKGENTYSSMSNREKFQISKNEEAVNNNSNWPNLAYASDRVIPRSLQLRNPFIQDAQSDKKIDLKNSSLTPHKHGSTFF